MENNTSSHRGTRLLQWSLTIAIVIVLNLLLNVGVQLFSPEPKYDDFCEAKQIQKQYTEQESCLSVGGQWVEGDVRQLPSRGEAVSVTAPIKYVEQEAYCNPNFTCAKEFSTAREEYNRNVFLVLVAGGLISLLIGAYALTSTAVSLGFSWEGVLSFVVGTIHYWSDINEYLRFVLLIIVLGVLVWLGVKKLRD